MADVPKHAVIFCHPRRDSFNGAVADAYRAAVEEIGHEVCLRDLYRMGFDPVLKDEERPGEPGFRLHADVEEELRILSGAKVFVFVYPIWFGTPPAMLKSYVERVFGSGFSHRDMREEHRNRLLSGGHLLSLTSSGNTKNWLDEQAQWLSLRDVFDHYLKAIFSMASDETRFDFGFGALTAGAWLEYADTYRQQRDIDLVTGQPDYAEKAVKDPITGATLPTPANIRFDQNSSTNQAEEFVELELRPLPGLKITPGYKHLDFTRRIDAAYNQTTRIPQRVTSTYSADLPFLTANYAVNNRLSVYGQYAKGFLAPPLKALYVLNPSLSDLQPEKSTNYQGGFVYHGSRLSLDADYYHIDFSNKFTSVTSPVKGEGKIFINEGAVTYKGFEGQVTYAFNNGLAVFANGSQNYAKTHNPGEPHTQVPTAPFWTAAGGLLFKHGPLDLSLIDKVLGPQYADNGEPAAYRIPSYNTAILSARYSIGRMRLGLTVSDLFDSRSVTDISPGNAPEFDQYYFQPGREITGDITIRF